MLQFKFKGHLLAEFLLAQDRSVLVLLGTSTVIGVEGIAYIRRAICFTQSLTI